MSFAEVTVGLGQAVVQNEEAMNTFAMMTREEKQAIWAQARQARSKADMDRIVNSIGK